MRCCASAASAGSGCRCRARPPAPAWWSITTRDPARPGDASRHRLPLLVGTIAGAHVDPADGRVALRLSRIASAEGPAQPNPGRSPVGYCAAALLDQLRLGPWRAVAPVSLEQALALRRAEGIGRA